MKVFILLTLFILVEPTCGVGQISIDSSAKHPAVQIDWRDTMHLVSSAPFKNYQELLHELFKKNF